MEFVIISPIGVPSLTTESYKARIKRRLSFVCIKKRPRPGPPSLDSVVALHRSLPPHPNILPLLAYYATPRNIYRVYEYAAGGCMRQIILSDKGLPEGALRLFGCDLVRLLHHVHTSGVGLGALTPESLFLDENGTVRLGSLKGASRLPGFFDVGCSRAYAAPEYLRTTSAPLTYSGDLWSLGVCLWELACGCLPQWENGELSWDGLLLPVPGRSAAAAATKVSEKGGARGLAEIDSPPLPPVPRTPPSFPLSSS